MVWLQKMVSFLHTVYTPRCIKRTEVELSCVYLYFYIWIKTYMNNMQVYIHLGLMNYQCLDGSAFSSETISGFLILQATMHCENSQVCKFSDDSKSVDWSMWSAVSTVERTSLMCDSPDVVFLAVSQGNCGQGQCWCEGLGCLRDCPSQCQVQYKVWHFASVWGILVDCTDWTRHRNDTLNGNPMTLLTYFKT